MTEQLPYFGCPNRISSLTLPWHAYFLFLSSLLPHFVFYFLTGPSSMFAVAVIRTDDSRAAAAGDFDGDGIVDLLIANNGQTNELLLGNGAGAFVSTLLERADRSMAITTGDFNKGKSESRALSLDLFRCLRVLGVCVLTIFFDAGTQMV
eukprot:SAG31_NODE_250_length_19098_cov_4.337123_7_plen_150_part_00